MKCVVTAGPTYEPLDRVRRLTNFSTGRLGTELANFLTGRGHEVTLLLGEMATWRGDCKAANIVKFSTTQDLASRLEGLGTRGVDAVFHAAAVSDFAFGRIFRRGLGGELIETGAGKVSSRAGPYMTELVDTPKIISRLREWFPNALLIGWKYEVDTNQAATIGKAREQIAQCRTDACVANGPAYGRGFGLVRAQGQTHCRALEELFEALSALVAERAKR